MWLNSVLAGLSKYNDTASKANNTDSVPSTHKSPQTPIKDQIIGNPCKHDWLLANLKDSKGEKLMYKNNESPTKEMAGPSKPISAPPMPLVGMIATELVQ